MNSLLRIQFPGQEPEVIELDAYTAALLAATSAEWRYYPESATVYVRNSSLYGALTRRAIKPAEAGR